MTFLDENTSREDLQCVIINDGELYATVDEAKFLADGYATPELLAIVREFIEAGDECA
jgi:hypothetical protein